MSPTIIKTADGSHSLFVEKLNEHYHSIHGAIQESKHIFIDAGLKGFISFSELSFQIQGDAELNILEIGLGTGLNALLTVIEANKLKININYTAIEAYPISSDIANELNFIECLNERQYQSAFNTIHTCEWEKPTLLSEHFAFYKIKNRLQEIVFEGKFNLIYFDAFGPAAQPEMWEEKLFAKLFAALEPKGCLVTYCAKGEVKRILKRVGFTVESLQGPPGKREMVRARKN